MTAKAEPDPQVHFAALREWVQKLCDTGHPVRQSACGMGLSAIVHRLLKYGPDETLNTCSARDLLRLLIYTNGPVAEYLMRVAYTRSIIEGDHEVYEHFNQTLFVPECRAWYWRIVEAVMGKAPDPADVTAWVDGMQGEEKSVARLIIARVYPDVAHLSWLEDVPPSVPRLGAELASVLLQRREYTDAVKRWLREHPEARFSVPEIRWPRL